MEKVSDYLFRIIAEKTSVRHIFMLPGGGCMHLVDSLGRRKDLSYICNLHEQACAIAAEAYAQNNNELGAVLVTAGPGSTNAITGVAGAWIDSTPLLILSGQAKREDLMLKYGVRQMGIQEVNIARIAAPITKYAKCVLDPDQIPYELEKALHLATTGRRGPVWLDIPLDVQSAMIDPDRLEHFVPEKEPEDSAEVNAAADQILAALKESKRPAIYAGNGIRAAHAVPEFLDWAESLQIPILTSWKAADFLPEDHPLFAGRPGIVAQRGANFVQQGADCLILLGTRLDLCQTGFNHPCFAPNAKKFEIDIDPAEAGKLNMKLEGKFVLDAGKVIRALRKKSDSIRVDYSDWLRQCKAWQAKYPVILPEYLNEEKAKVNLYHLISVLSDQLGSDDLLVPGSSGACAEITMQAIKVKSGLRIQNTPGLGSMGFGLPAVIGASLASGKKTVGIVGDGGLQHNIQELQTLKNLDLPIKLFVLNNGGYGSIVNMQRARFQGNYVACNEQSGLHLPDLERLANAYRLPFIRISSPKDLADQVRRVLEKPGTVLCEVVSDPDIPSAPRLITDTLPDGRMVSRPMQDLAPSIPEEEFRDISNRYFT
ncbi:MAG: thiamine pyrophosphate-binding protein [Planctomycetia bacterium]|nr:thiamine pyrophosphate-binding protein [Planctomycetia bacterium]